MKVGSLPGFNATPLLAVYVATKAFQTNLTDAIINEIKDSHVTMTLLVPGFTNAGIRIDSLTFIHTSFIFSLKVSTTITMKWRQHAPGKKRGDIG